ncbi:PIR Superfamily Protein [Plasmodium ovale curtisi]|uniref:PIR Superfamily Protein n=1 Tax=Plasmodium ovale curtisi TaxID=864141 RepID=A0A1A8WWI3_PLAOA|nr:PIR Superfamily Protein [Plasmodium ovale curtisi]
MVKTGKKLSVGDYYDIFFKIRDEFNSLMDDEYAEYLYKEDQVLLNIALYLLENFKGGYIYSCNEEKDCNERCTYLNKWLNEKKALYTSNGNCTHNNKLWEQYIEGLWNELQRDSGEDKKCERVKLKKKFPVKRLIPSCNNSNTVKIEASCPKLPEPQEKECPLSEVPKSSSCKAVLTTSYVVFGVLLFSMYLLRFSSVGMKLNNLIRGKKIKKRNMGKENNESFISPDNSDMESLDRRFNVIYNSLQN